MCNPSFSDSLPSPPPSPSPSSSSSHSKNHYNFGSRFRKPSLRSMAQVKEQSSLFFCDSSFDEEPRHILDSCSRCKARLHVGGDIYMYRGDTPFCSDECRQEQIETDESEVKKTNKLKMCSKNLIKSKIISNPKSRSHVTKVACSYY